LLAGPQNSGNVQASTTSTAYTGTLRHLVFRTASTIP